MRRLRAMGALLALAACDPLVPPALECAAPCPRACPDTCLPSGFCRDLTVPLAELLGTPRFGVTRVDRALGDLPPEADVAVSVRGAVDFHDRENRVPWPWELRMNLDADRIVADGRVAGTTFPVVFAWEGRRRTDADGALHFLLAVDVCDGRLPTECVLSEDATLTLTLVDDLPWLSCRAPDS